MRKSKKNLANLVAILLIVQSLINPFGQVTFAAEDESIQVYFNKPSTEAYFDDSETKDADNIIDDTPVEVVVVSDYVGEKKAQLESEIEKLKENANGKNLKVNSHYLDMWDEGNNVVLGQSIEPTFEYFRAVHIQLQFDVFQEYTLYSGNKETRPGIWNISDKFSKVVITEAEEINLDSYPDSIAKIYVEGHDVKINLDKYGWHDVQWTGLQYDVFNNSKDLTIRKTLPSYTIMKNGHMSNYGYHDDINQEEANCRLSSISVDKQYQKGAQVGTKLADIISFNFDKINSLSITDETEKYLIIVTDKANSLKGLTLEKIDLLKQKGYRIRYSIPKEAELTRLGSPYFVDVTKKGDSILLKDNCDKYYQIGNNSTVGVKVYPVDITKTITNADQSLFNEKIKLSSPELATDPKTVLQFVYYKNYTVNQAGRYSVSGSFGQVGLSLKDGVLSIDNKIVFSGVKQIYQLGSFLGVEMIEGNAKLICPQSCGTQFVSIPRMPMNLSGGYSIKELEFKSFKIFGGYFKNNSFELRDNNVGVSINGTHYSQDVFFIGDNNEYCRWAYYPYYRGVRYDSSAGLGYPYT